MNVVAYEFAMCGGNCITIDGQLDQPADVKAFVTEANFYIS